MEERLGEADEASFEALFLSDETRARAPSLDLEDEDVFGLDQVEQTAQIIESPEDEDREIVEDLSETEEEGRWAERVEPTVSPKASVGRIAALAAPRRSSMTREQNVLLGFLLFNVVGLGGLFFYRGRLANEGPPARMESTGGTTDPGVRIAGAPAGEVPGVELDGNPTTGSPPAPLTETSAPPSPEPSPSQRAQECIDRGAYREATTLLEDALRAPGSMTLLQRRAAFSALAYCAEQQGQTDRGAYFRAAQANLQALAATPENAWAAARDAQRRGDHEQVRRRFARLLLRQDQLIEAWQRPECVGSAVLAVGAAYQEDAVRRTVTEAGDGR